MTKIIKISDSDLDDLENGKTLDILGSETKYTISLRLGKLIIETQNTYSEFDIMNFRSFLKSIPFY